MSNIISNYERISFGDTMSLHMLAKNRCSFIKQLIDDDPNRSIAQIIEDGQYRAMWLFGTSYLISEYISSPLIEEARLLISEVEPSKPLYLYQHLQVNCNTLSLISFYPPKKAYAFDYLKSCADGYRSALLSLLEQQGLHLDISFVVGREPMYQGTALERRKLLFSSDFSCALYSNLLKQSLAQYQSYVATTGKLPVSSQTI